MYVRLSANQSNKHYTHTRPILNSFFVIVGVLTIGWTPVFQPALKWRNNNDNGGKTNHPSQHKTVKCSNRKKNPAHAVKMSTLRLTGSESHARARARGDTHKQNKIAIKLVLMFTFNSIHSTQMDCKMIRPLVVVWDLLVLRCERVGEHIRIQLKQCTRWPKPLVYAKKTV